MWTIFRTVKIKSFDLSSLNDENNNNRNEISQACVVQHMKIERENLKTNNTLWFPFVRDFTYDSDDCQSDHKKYKVSFLMS